jgi:hypothetical protein
MGFSGFEGRSYSLFCNFGEDMAAAVDLQNLITALAFKYIAEGRVTHDDIPDDPFIESERRQIVFGRAVGLPTFFVLRDTPNRLLRRIAETTDRVRPSRRYPGYLRVQHRDYTLRLLAVLREDAADLVELLGLSGTLDDLARRLVDPDGCSVCGKLTRAILARGNAVSPMSMKAADFNRAAEGYYREDLRRSHLREGLRYLEDDLRRLRGAADSGDEFVRQMLHTLLQENDSVSLIASHGQQVIDEQASAELLKRIIALLLFCLLADEGREKQGCD